MKRLFLLIPLVFVLASCAMPVVQEDDDAINFSCTDNKVITVRHPTPDSVELTFDGRRFRLQRVAADSGERYVNEDDGVQPGAGLIWWRKEDVAILQDLVPGPRASIVDYPLISTCKLL